MSMISAVNHVAGLKLLQRAEIIKKIKSERGEMFGLYFHNRMMCIISPFDTPSGRAWNLEKRKNYRKKALAFNRGNLF